MKGLDYLALGHWHSLAIFPDSKGVARTAYSGTPEPSSFGERDSGKVLIVEIESPGAPPRITPVSVGGLTWEVLEFELRQEGDLNRLKEEIESIHHPESTLLALKVSGFIRAEDQGELVHLKEIITCPVSLPGGRISPGWCHPPRMRPGFLLASGHSSGNRFRLLAFTNSGFTGPRPDFASPEVATQALMELFLLSKGGRP